MKNCWTFDTPTASMSTSFAFDGNLVKCCETQLMCLLFVSAEQQLLQQLQSMPVRTDTLRIRTRKEELEKKLSEVAEAIKIFSRPKVFVKIDS